MYIDEEEINRLNKEKVELIKSLVAIEKEFETLQDSLKKLTLTNLSGENSPIINAEIQKISKQIDELSWRIKMHRQEIINVDVEMEGCFD